MRHHIPEPVTSLAGKLHSHALRMRARVATALRLDSQPWRHWAAIYFLLLPFFTAYRCVGLDAMLTAFATPHERTTGATIAVLMLGLWEDLVLVTMLLVVLSACDFVLGPRRNPAPLEEELPVIETTTTALPATETPRARPESPRVLDQEAPAAAAEPPPVAEDDEPIVPLYVRRQAIILARRILRLCVHAWLTVLVLVPFAVDIMLLRTRGLRFAFAFSNIHVRKSNPLAGVEISRHEERLSTETRAITFTVIAVVVVLTMTWLDLSRWHLAKLIPSRILSRKDTFRRDPLAAPMEIELSKVEGAGGDHYVCLEDGDRRLGISSSRSQLVTDGYILASDASHSIQHPQSQSPSQSTKATRPSKPIYKRIQWKRLARSVGVPVLVVFLLVTALLITTHNVRPFISATALNGSLNWLFSSPFNAEFLRSLDDGKIESAAAYIHTETETFELFQDDVLYRKTTGFKGPLAFDVAVNKTDLPNVLVLVVESFRYQDSLYILGNASRALLNKQHNITLTPNFDRWAKRGVAFRNLWSSYQTSRSVESILYGQIPYDHVAKSGSTLKKQAEQVELHGMPQLFHAHGYETTFTSGVRLKYDQWSQFMLHHGFDYVWGSTSFKAYGEKDYGINASDWKSTANGGEGRAGYWGVHDDVSFDVLGDLMVNKTREQQARVRLGEPKKPFFINHYTVSSHTPYLEYPEWFNSVELPDFSALSEGNEAHAEEIQKYAKLRYFEDLALGKFLDHLQSSGVLNNTIVVIVGDHGQSPEKGFAHPETDEVATTRVAAALIAEGGQLGNYSGLVIEDAAEQYDLLNTLADIVGVPDGGFLQSGVGRSLKRAVKFGDRAVWSNNPSSQFGIVQGHKRLSYDRIFSRMELFDTENDPEETNDLLPETDETERAQWETLRRQGRRLAQYFRVRWDRKCISKVKC